MLLQIANVVRKSNIAVACGIVISVTLIEGLVHLLYLLQESQRHVNHSFIPDTALAAWFKSSYLPY
jgi:hypothetical protein